MQQGVQKAVANNQRPPVEVMSPTMVPTCLPALEEVSTPPSMTSSNSITSDLTIQTMQQQMEMMKKMVEMVKMMQAQNKPRKNKRRTTNLTKYCHTRSLCNHDSPDCCTPAEGHKNEATLQNRMGGSTRNITWQSGPVLSINVACEIRNFFTPNHTRPVAQSNIPQPSVTMKADSGASKHFIRQSDDDILSNIQTSQSTSVILLDKTNLMAIMKGTLPLNKLLSPRANIAHVLPGLWNSSLLFIGQLCDNERTVLFRKKTSSCFKNADLMLMGKHNKNDGLWDVEIKGNHTKTKNKHILHVNAIITKYRTKSELVDFLHLCAFSPTPTTFQKATKNQNFATWPAIDSINFEKIIGDKTSIYMGHMDQVQQNLQSIKTKQ